MRRIRDEHHCEEDKQASAGSQDLREWPDIRLQSQQRIWSGQCYREVLCVEDDMMDAVYLPTRKVRSASCQRATTCSSQTIPSKTFRTRDTRLTRRIMKFQRRCEECGRPIDSKNREAELCRKCSQRRNRKRVEASKLRSYRRLAARQL